MAARGAYGHDPGPASIRLCCLMSPRCTLCASGCLFVRLFTYTCSLARMTSCFHALAPHELLLESQGALISRHSQHRGSLKIAGHVVRALPGTAAQKGAARASPPALPPPGRPIPVTLVRAVPP